jgi:hypothetical protein
MKTQAEIEAELARHCAWMDENEGRGSSEEGVEWGWVEALAWTLGVKP